VCGLVVPPLADAASAVVVVRPSWSRASRRADALSAYAILSGTWLLVSVAIPEESRYRGDLCIEPE
jgi:hypothetical protein